MLFVLQVCTDVLTTATTSTTITSTTTMGSIIHILIHIQTALCSYYARLCFIMLIMLILCSLCFMLRPCDYAIFDASIIRSPQMKDKRHMLVVAVQGNAKAA